MTYQSSVASRRSVPQLPPIHTSLSDSLLKPPSQAPSNLTLLQTGLSERSVYPIPTPAPSPANFPVERPKTQPPTEPKEDIDLPVPTEQHKPLKPIKSVRSKRSLFKLFSSRNTEDLDQHIETGLSHTADTTLKTPRDDQKHVPVTEKFSSKSRSKSQDRSALGSNSHKILRPKTSEGSGRWRQSPPPDLPTRSKDEVLLTKPSDSTRKSSTIPPAGKKKGQTDQRAIDITNPISTKRSQTSLHDCNDYRKMWKPPPLFQAYPQAIKYSTSPTPSNSDEAQPSLQMASSKSNEDGSTGPENGSNDRPKSRWRSSSTSNSEPKANRSAEHQHINVLVTTGYLLQYSPEGPSDRYPEKTLKLTANSAAFASDLIPGKHWVLQVMSELHGDLFQASTEPKSFLHRLRHSSSNLTVSTLLMVFDCPQDMDGWMTTIRREIDILAGRKSRQTSPSQDAEGGALENLSSIERYKSISRTSLQPLPHMSGPNSPTIQYAPRSPTKFIVPLSPSTSNSEWMSNSTGPGTSVSEWSSARSSQQTNAAKPTNLGKNSSSGTEEDYHIPDTGLDLDSKFVPGLQISFNRSPDVGVQSAIPRRLSSLQLHQVQDPNTLHKEHEMLRSSEDADEAIPEFTKDDSEFYKDFLKLVSDCEGFSIENDVPLMSPSAIETAFPQPPRSSRRLSKMPPISGHPNFPSSSGCSPMESISESTPYFSRRLPDPVTLEEPEPEPVLYKKPSYGTVNTSSSPQSTTTRSSVRISMTPQQIRAAATAQSKGDQPSSMPPSRRTSALLTSNSDSWISTLNALNGDIPQVVPSATPPSDTPSRRTSIMRSSKTPLPFRASMQFQQTPVPSAVVEQSTNSPPSAPPAKLLRRPNSMQVRNDPAPFLTTVRSAPSSRTPSMIAEPASKRSSTSVPIVRPPMRTSSFRRQQGALMFQNPSRAPPNIPLPTPPPNAPLPPTPQNSAP